MRARMSTSPPLIVCLSSTDWSFLRYRKQHLMERLSQRADVVYVNPPRAVKAQEWPFRQRTRQLSSRLWVHEPFVMPGMRRSSIAKHITYGWLAARLEQWRRGRQCVLWLYLAARTRVRRPAASGPRGVRRRRSARHTQRANAAR